VKASYYVSWQYPPEVDPRQVFAEHVEQVRYVRDHGCHAIFIGQHFLSEPWHMAQPVSMVARLAAEAEMQIGCGVRSSRRAICSAGRSARSTDMRPPEAVVQGYAAAAAKRGARIRASTSSATSRGTCFYVGKAKALRSRVRSYFQAGRGDTRQSIPRLVPRIADLEVIVTSTEVEALHLEQNLVKRHRPPFNVRLRDDKSFPYICVAVEDDYPRVMFTRERHRRGVRREIGSVDVIGIAAEGDRAAVQVFPLRGGKMIDRHGFHLENVEGQDVSTILEAFSLEYYGNAPSIPPQIVVPPEATGLEALAQFLSELRGSRVEVRAPARGDKLRLAVLASQNACVALDSEVAASEQKRLRRVHALEELREALNLESLPLRIECFDISNIQGQEIVGSMVVFQDGIPKKAPYRKFGVRGLDGQDDFAAMAEVVSRRFARLGTGVEEEYDEGFATAPNLVVIDGGKGQLSAALAAMQAYELPRVAVISLAKRIEEVFLPGESLPILLDPHSAGLQLLQRVRDEAHRFALGFHRQRRFARARESLFDTLEGVGPARRRALLRHFGSTEGVIGASQEELEAVPGLPAKTARAIYAQLHKTGGA